MAAACSTWSATSATRRTRAGPAASATSARRPSAPCAISAGRRPPKPGIFEQVLRSLRRRDGQSTGQLFRELGDGGGAAAAGADRKRFERLLGGLTRAGLVQVREDSFEKDGQLIRFQRASLTPEGERAGADAVLQVPLTEEAAETGKKKRRDRSDKTTVSAGSRRPSQAALPGAAEPRDQPIPAVVDALKAWRRAEAQRRRVPAFRILTDRALHALASVRPEDEKGLLEISGVGPTIVSKYGRESSCAF